MQTNKGIVVSVIVIAMLFFVLGGAITPLIFTVPYKHSHLYVAFSAKNNEFKYREIEYGLLHGEGTIYFTDAKTGAYYTVTTDSFFLTTNAHADDVVINDKTRH